MASKQSHELQVSSVTVLGDNDVDTNPLQPKYQTPEFLRTIPHLRARVPSHALLLRLRSQLIASVTSFFNDRGFVQTHTPIITSSDCEGAGEVFKVSPNEPVETKDSVPQSSDSGADHYFRTPKYLTVSAQLHLEALAQAVNRVWTLSPVFRAERSDTPRHLSEFYMLEAEMCFTDNLDQVMDLVEDMLRTCVTTLMSSRVALELTGESGPNHTQDSNIADTLDDQEGPLAVAALRQRWVGLSAPNWPRVTYTRAMDILSAAPASTFAQTPSFHHGFQAEHERYLANVLGQGKPVFITHYPTAQKPFYMSPSSGSQTAECFDLLVPGQCELVGGSLRQHRAEDLIATMRDRGIEGRALDWYLDLRRYGSVPHGGFGLGFDRLVAYLGGIANVRDVVVFPRWVGRCEC